MRSIERPGGRRARGFVLVLAALAAAFFLTPSPAHAQDPIHWSASSKTTTAKPGELVKVEVVLKADEGWHVYSLAQAPPPIATRITVPPGQPYTLAGTVDGPSARVSFDQNFGVNTEFYEGSALFTLSVKVAQDAASGRTPLKVQAYYQTCNDQICLPPKAVPMEVPLDIVGGTAKADEARSSLPVKPPTTPSSSGARPGTEASTPPPMTSAPAPASSASVSQAPVTSSSSLPTAAATTPASPAAPAATAPNGGVPQAGSAMMPIAAVGRGSQSFWSFLWLAMTVGALSLLTPCVFPMVPITVSYFTKHAAGSRGRAVEQAVIFMLGIVLTFTALGMAMALLVGATSLNRFAANPWINLLITAIFLGFAASLFGVFDLQLPPALVNRVDALTRRPGGSRTVATLLMGLTFTLTSFTCTAPFIGTLLVMAAGGEWQWPLAGMLAFSTVFALPFFVLALMPQWMASLPKSGGWLNSVKVLMAFLEVAAAMKFLSNVDLVWGWGVFTHDVVLASWVAVFLLMALYVLGLFRFGHDAPVDRVGLGRLTTSLVCATIGLWMVTGLAGKPLGELEAFLPPASGILAASGTSGTTPVSDEQRWILNDYEGALARARRDGKRVFIDFTGYTCTNCRWMEANMFPREDVRLALSEFVLVRLFTDGEGEVYQRQQQLQQAMYKTVALPYYAVVTPDGRPVMSFPGLTRDPAQFVSFLKKARG